jgi:hypothetical protein
MNKKIIKFKLPEGGEKEFTFWYGTGFLGNAIEKLEMTIDEIINHLNKNPFKVLPILLHESYSYGFWREGKECDYRLVDMIDLIDENGISEASVTSWINGLTESLTKDTPKVKKGNDDKPKKK